MKNKDKSTWDSFVIQMNQMGSARIPFLFVIDFEKEKPLLFPLDDMPEDVYYDIRHKHNGSFITGWEFKTLNFDKNCVNLETYTEAFNEIKKELNYGNSFLANLTFENEIKSNYNLSEIYKNCTAPYKLLWQDQFVVFSPECFVKINEGIISTFPMKGTIDANIPNAKEIILADQKELHEHNTIVDLLRNDINLVAKKTQVNRFRFIEKIENNFGTLLQVSSEISAELSADYTEQLGTIFDRLLPAGSICGAPKKKTVDIIRRVEKRERGYYTGVFGIFDGQNLDSAVMIRFIKKDEEGKLFYCAGGGITHQSNLQDEFEEMKNKVYVPIV